MLEPCAARTASVAHKPPLDRQARGHQCLTECQRVGDVFSKPGVYHLGALPSAGSTATPARLLSSTLHLVHLPSITRIVISHGRR